MNSIDHIKTLIGQNQIPSVFEELKRIPLSDDLSNQLVLIEGRYSEVAKGKRLGTTSKHEVELSFSEIRFSLIDLCDIIVETNNARPSALPQSKFLLNFENIIHSKTENFIGREWLFSAIEELIERKPKGYIIIKGEPGVGKSAIASKIIKDRKGECLYHFIVKSSGINDPAQFLGNIMAQLILKFHLVNKEITDKSLQNGSLFIDLLNEASKLLKAENKKLLLVIDGLDELKETSQSSGENTLFLPSELPDNVFILLTYRIVSRVSLNSPTIIKEIGLDQKDKLNKQDAAEYIKRDIPSEGIQNFIKSNYVSESQFLDLLLEKSQNNFMYLRHVLPEIQSGNYKNLDINEIPAGLQSYYEDHWKRMKTNDKTQWYNIYLPLISLLAIIKTPIAIEFISGITNIDINNVRSAIDSWREFLFNDYYEAVIPVYRIYHQAYSDFLSKKDEIGEEIDLNDMRSKYINFFE
ncbi:MAG: NACHT domain-containing protein [Haliscomenobacter sp.]|uniref:AAA family ATPase n=1 Tax=Haliscomenobacter sp. TaxID=2717303 RepID=UPI0029BEE96A|nr:AAA family ATPase [Haliscomenobacter sp.]MDX2070854.1 NACHT domain-containing protein [Haliscomenobacter sp.]